jgi:hypothetical protein
MYNSVQCHSVIWLALQQWICNKNKLITRQIMMMETVNTSETSINIYETN